MELRKNASLIIVDEIQLTYSSSTPYNQRPEVTNSKQAADILRSCWDHHKLELQEQFRILLLSSANRLLGSYECSSGSTIQTLADPRLIFVCALKANAQKIILAHNHPSGTVEPSPSDQVLTQKLKSGADLLNLKIIDHIILTRDTFYSFSDEGLL
nr:JAB domain-containing protein [Pedobacter sp. ASV19]